MAATTHRFPTLLAFEGRRLAFTGGIISKNLGYTLVFKNIRLENSNIRGVIYFIKSEKLTVNHVFNLKNDCLFALAD